MKVCIVGASGKLGRYMVQHALDRNFEVVGVCREQSMMNHYASGTAQAVLDASALVKRYVREAGSITVRRLLASGIPASSRLSEVEVSSGIIRRAREGAFTTPRRDRMLAAL